MAEKIDFKLDEESFFKKHQQNQNMPRNDALKQIMLKRIMRDFEPGRVYSELKDNEMDALDMPTLYLNVACLMPSCSWIACRTFCSSSVKPDKKALNSSFCLS